MRKEKKAGLDVDGRTIIGDEANQSRLTSSWKRLTTRLAELSETIPAKQQEVS